jgi:zinc protease
MYFTQPRADTAAFRRYSERLGEYTRGRVADPDATFGDSVAAAITQHHPRAIKGDARFVSAIDPVKALSFWKARMANPSSFTMVMTGDFTLDRARSLVTRYLASLPSGAAERSRDVGIRFPHGVVHQKIVAGKGPKARTQIILSGPFDGNTEGSDGLGAATDLAELALNSQIRERLGGTYGASVRSSVKLVPPATYAITIDFEASPDRIDSLATAAIAELDRLRATGPTEAEYQKIKAARVRDLDGKIESNSYWANELSWHARMGWPLGTIKGHQLDAKLLSIGTLRSACATYLGTSEYVQVTMYPVNAKRP